MNLDTMRAHKRHVERDKGVWEEGEDLLDWEVIAGEQERRG